MGTYSSNDRRVLTKEEIRGILEGNLDFSPQLNTIGFFDLFGSALAYHKFILYLSKRTTDNMILPIMGSLNKVYAKYLLMQRIFNANNYVFRWWLKVR